MAKVIRSSSVRPYRPGWMSSQSPQTRNNAKTNALLTDLAGALARARYAHPATQKRLAEEIVRGVLRERRYPDALKRAFETCTDSLVRTGLASLYSTPARTEQATAETRSDVRQRLAYLQNEETDVAAWRRQLSAALSQLAHAIPTTNTDPANQVITVPLVALLDDPIGVIDTLVRELCKLARHMDAPELWPGAPLAARILTNLLTVSQLSYQDAAKRPQRLTWPADAKLSPSVLVDTYLTDTPLAALLKTPVDLPIPKNVRTEHALYIAPPGHGKTQLLQALFLRDINDPDQPAIVIIDSQLDLVALLSRLKQFDPKLGRRVIILDPTDTIALALNLFGWDRRYAATLPSRRREAYLASITQTFHFVCAGLFKNDLTPRMSTVFNFLFPWLMQIPNATIHTLLSMLRDPQPYWHHVAALPETARTFLEELFADGSPYRDTRQHIMQRLYTIIANPQFERMFANPENKFDMRSALNDGRIVLISTDKAGLGAEYSAIFGRFIVAQVLQAATARAFIPLEHRRAAYVYVDECHEVLDASTEMLLFQARKYACSINLFTQQLSQLRTAGMIDTALSVPAIKYIGAVSNADAAILARELKTTPEFIRGVRKTAQDAEWTVHVRNVTPSATRITVPFFQAERAPQMSAQAYQQLLMLNRRDVGAAPHTATPTSAAPEPTSPPPITNDGESY